MDVIVEISDDDDAPNPWRKFLIFVASVAMTSVPLFSCGVILHGAVCPLKVIVTTSLLMENFPPEVRFLYLTENVLSLLNVMDIFPFVIPFLESVFCNFFSKEIKGSDCDCGK